MIVSKPEEVKYDVIVVGSGPAAMGTIMPLLELPIKILMIESGGQMYDAKVSQLSQVSAVGDLQAPYYGVHSQRILGGGSHIWEGYCTTFEERSFLNKEWPIPYAELQKHYLGATDILNLPAEAVAQNSRPIGEQTDIIYKPFFRTRKQPFTVKYKELFESHPRLHVMPGWTCVKVLHNRSSVKGLMLRESSGKDQSVVKVEAGRYVLACGGIGTPKLLLNSGFGDTHASVGKFFMEHPHVYRIAKLLLVKEKVDNLLSLKRVVHALQLSDQYCFKHNLLSISFDFNTQEQVDAILLGKKQACYAGFTTIRSEMKALPGNNLTLSNSEDYLGGRNGHMNFKFKYHDLLRRTWKHVAELLLKHEVGRVGITRSHGMTGGGHLMGTTRMGLTASDSVVDENCQVHGFENIYLSGSSVFPAGAAANPTFTIVALGLRLGQHLAGIIKGAP